MTLRRCYRALLQGQIDTYPSIRSLNAICERILRSSLSFKRYRWTISTGASFDRDLARCIRMRAASIERIRIYACIYICIYIYMYVCMYVCMCTCVIYKYTHVYKRTCMYESQIPRVLVCSSNDIFRHYAVDVLM
jgi:hypothetical protein